MKFQFSEKKVKLPGNVHAYAEKKVMKLARYFEEDAEALVVFSVEKNRNKVELTVHGAGTWFRASESTSDMFASIDAAVGTVCAVSYKAEVNGATFTQMQYYPLVDHYTLVITATDIISHYIKI